MTIHNSTALEEDASVILIDHFDKEALDESLEREHGIHSNRVQLDGGIFSGQIVRLPSESVNIHCGTFNRRMLTTGRFVRDQVMIAMHFPDEHNNPVNRHIFNTPCFMIYPAQAPIFWGMSAMSKWITVCVPQEKLGWIGLNTVPRETEIYAMKGKTAAAVIQVMTTLPPFRQHAVSENSREEFCDGTDQLIDMIGGILAELESKTVELSDTLLQSRFKLVRNCCNRFFVHADVSMKMEDICDAFGVPLYTLERAFRSVLDIGPRHYLTLERLSRVRKEIIQETQEVWPRSLTDIAHACGFEHMGRFAALYKAHFGELPSVTRQLALKKIAHSQTISG